MDEHATYVVLCTRNQRLLLPYEVLPVYTDVVYLLLSWL